MLPLSAVESRRYSQNGEDGLIAYLAARVREPTRTFVEIGCATGAKCNSAALAQDGWRGVAVDAEPARVQRYQARFPHVRTMCCRVAPDNVAALHVPDRPQVFSLDIDGPDYHVAKALLRTGFRPAVAVLEYNAALGEYPLSVPAQGPFSKSHYFGCGIAAWRHLWGKYGYQFVTVDSAGVNALFVDAQQVPIEDLTGVAWLAWADCRSLAARFGSADERWRTMAHLPFVDVRGEP